MRSMPLFRKNIMHHYVARWSTINMFLCSIMLYLAAAIYFFRLPLNITSNNLRYSIFPRALLSCIAAW